MLNAIKLKIKTRDITPSEQTLTTGSVGMPVYFSFSSDWDNLSKIVIFKAGEVTETVSLTGDHVIIPASLFSIDNLDQDLLIGVYGYNDNGQLVIPTVYESVGIIELGADGEIALRVLPIVGIGQAGYMRL